MPYPCDAEFETFYRTYRARVHRVAVRLVGETDADDVTQEVMLRAARHLEHGFSGEPWPWLEIVTRRLAVDHFRKNRRVAPADDSTLAELGGVVADDPSDVAIRTDQRGRLARALHRLPASDRAILVRHEVDGATVVSMAALHGVSANALRQRLFRARRNLAHHYEQLGGRSLGMTAPLKDIVSPTRTRWSRHRPAWLSRLTETWPVQPFNGHGRAVAAAVAVLSAAPFVAVGPPSLPGAATAGARPPGRELRVPGPAGHSADRLRRIPREVRLPSSPGGAPGAADALGPLRWTRQPGPGPSARAQPAMAYDEQRHETVLFGGEVGGAALGETWTRAGGTWSRRDPAASPSARTGASMAYDAARGEMVLFGGYQPGTGYLGDTWVWDGHRWTQRFPVTMPPPRGLASLAYDPARAVLVLFSGECAVGQVADTWTWDGVTWTKSLTSSGPAARHTAMLAYDPARQRMLLRGGSESWRFNDTWSWDGTTWVELIPDVVPEGPAADTHVVYDRAVRRVVAFGGPNAWAWAGTAWRSVDTTDAPPDLHYPGVAYDSARSEIVLFGGAFGSRWRGDTWTATFGAPKPVGGHDTTPPISAVAASVRLAGEPVTGTATDEASGVASVVVTFTPVVAGSPSGAVTVVADLACTDHRRHCTWTASGPDGAYRVSVAATDLAGNRETTGPEILAAG